MTLAVKKRVTIEWRQRVPRHLAAAPAPTIRVETCPLLRCRPAIARKRLLFAEPSLDNPGARFITQRAAHLQTSHRAAQSTVQCVGCPKPAWQRCPPRLALAGVSWAPGAPAGPSSMMMTSCSTSTRCGAGQPWAGLRPGARWRGQSSFHHRAELALPPRPWSVPGACRGQETRMPVSFEARSPPQQRAGAGMTLPWRSVEPGLGPRATCPFRRRR